ncbi:ATP-dependent DNA ligase [Granulicella mallensis]|uniref:DNA ligase n=1 Tax=Granulicella mallensis (strain ATCC BAA-1857 / DSM 23137 / MP5ACTX8) TaxID=682795 RepID=G8NTR2_GRAMM|nr:ATP-dependent DNA ligase [Granulicella mallensis]AEU36386.1 DNA ligase I, ATP-dependent Dnl1 [Granulicella mallensis MP5ACTX8]
MAFFVALATLAEKLSQEGSRLKKRAAIAEAIASLHAAAPESSDAGRFALYLAGQPFAENDARKLNAGGALLSRAVLTVAGADNAQLTAAYRRHGDLGAAAHDLLVAPHGKAPSTATLTLDDVADAFAAMAVARTTAARSSLVEGLLTRATAVEAKYLLKLMLGDMRIGVKQSLIEEAIAVASGTEVAAVRHGVMLEADLVCAVGRAFAGTLAAARMTLFHPLGFMLASPVETPEAAVERFTEAPAKEKPAKVAKPKKARKKRVGEDFVDLAPVQEVVARDAPEEGLAEDAQIEALASGELSAGSSGVLAFLEDKYDGMRAQVHCGDPSQPGRVAIYSRNREDITQSFPELAEAFAQVEEPMILDGEILGWDFGKSQALPFAVMGQRIGRKVVSDEVRRQIPAVFMAFDLLFVGDELLLPLPLTRRRMLLEEVVARWSEHARSALAADSTRKADQAGLFSETAPVAEQKTRWMLSPSQPVTDAAAIDQAYRDARARANEGVMLKRADSAYLPGRRGLAWVKLKRELATLDVVITGAEFGHGKRAGLLSDYTFAVRGQAGQLLNVGKAYSGLTDAEILEMTAWLKAHTLEDRGYFRTVEPQIVLEVAFNNIMRSSRHASGFALRFPRILHIRRDKPVSEIDTLEQVEAVYQTQPDRPDESLEE